MIGFYVLILDSRDAVETSISTLQLFIFTRIAKVSETVFITEI